MIIQETIGYSMGKYWCSTYPEKADRKSLKVALTHAKNVTRDNGEESRSHEF